MSLRRFHNLSKTTITNAQQAALMAIAAKSTRDWVIVCSQSDGPGVHMRLSTVHALRDKGLVWRKPPEWQDEVCRLAVVPLTPTGRDMAIDTASRTAQSETDCTCYRGCGEDSRSGTWHQHKDDPCPAHPAAPMVG